MSVVRETSFERPECNNSHQLPCNNGEGLVLWCRGQESFAANDDGAELAQSAAFSRPVIRGGEGVQTAKKFRQETQW